MVPNKILVRGPNWVGDAVLSVPVLKAIRAHFPEAEITLMVRPWVAGLFTSASFVDKVWRESKPSGIGDWARITRDIRSSQFDLALLLPNSFESALMMFLARVPQRVGYATDMRTWMLTTSILPPSDSRHQVHYYLDLAKALQARVDEPSIEIGVSEEERTNARILLEQAGIKPGEQFMVLNPGAAYGSAKRWHEDRFAGVADVLAEEMKLSVVLVGSAAEQAIAEQIQGQMKNRAAILTGRTSLEDLIGVLSESSLMITNDSGPMHIAAALGVPTVAIFGSTDERVTGPFGSRTRVVRHPVECSPCLLRECPIDHRCMNGVTVDDVCRAARDLVNAVGFKG